METVYNGFRIATTSYGLKAITREGSGRLPNTLTGLFTNEREAILAVDRYLANGTPKTKASNQ